MKWEEIEVGDVILADLIFYDKIEIIDSVDLDTYSVKVYHRESDRFHFGTISRQWINSGFNTLTICQVSRKLKQFRKELSEL